MDINKFEGALIAASSLLKSKEKQLKLNNKKLNKELENELLLKDTRLALIELSKQSRAKAIGMLEKTVQGMLSSTIDHDYKFEIELSTVANKPAVAFYVTETIGGIESRQDVMEDQGGGVQDIISTALRYAFLLTLHGGNKGPLILDEPARMISGERSPLYAEFLSDLSRSSGKQIILCTHNQDIKDKSDNLIEIIK